MLLSRAAWGQGDVEPTIVGLPPTVCCQGKTLSLRKLNWGGQRNWPCGPRAGQRAVPPRRTGTRGRDRTEPWASSHTVLTSCCLRMVLAGCICQSSRPRPPLGPAPTLLQDHMRTHTDISVTHMHKITHIISPIDADLCPQTPMHTHMYTCSQHSPAGRRMETKKPCGQQGRGPGGLQDSV